MRHGTKRRPAECLILGVMLSCLGACTGSPTPSDPDNDGALPPAALVALPRALTAPEVRTARAANHLTFRLLQQVGQALPSDNLVLSPLSASMALSMLSNGARAATLDSLRTALGMPDAPLAEINEGYRGLVALLTGLDATTEIAVANGFWSDPRQPIRTAFTDSLRRAYAAEVASLDFAAPGAAETVNRWVTTATRGKIPRLVDRFSADEIAFLVNAIYFKGKWRTPFAPADTRLLPFRGVDGRERSVPTMSSRAAVEARFLFGADVQGVELPYGNSAFVLTIVMPNDGDVNGLLARLDTTSWRSMLDRFTTSRAIVQLPKFAVDTRRTLNDDLKALGFRPIFLEGNPDLSGIGGLPGELFITRVVQRAVIEVDEAGTTAAAATGIGVGVTSAPQLLAIDRPFLFALRERFSGTVLFAGKIAVLGN